MCSFCKNIAYTDEEFVQARYKGGDFIYKDNDRYGILIDTGDGGCLGSLQGIGFCPICGRNLSEVDNNDCEQIY